MKNTLSESKQFSFLLILCAVVLLACSLLAGEAKLAWNASPSTNVANYLLRLSGETMIPTNPPLYVVNVGSNLTATLIFTNAGRWFVDCRAADTNGVQSESSNELILDVPEPPGQMRTVVLQYSASVTNNFSNVGLFRVEIK